MPEADVDRRMPTGEAPPDRDACASLDERDPLAGMRDRFHIPDGTVYLDGNSLGPLPHAVSTRLGRVVAGEWAQGLIRSWNDAGWIDLPARTGARIAPLIGAAPDEVIVADSTSINLFKLLAGALNLRPDRRVILSEEGNFPTDLYMAQGLATLVGRELRLQTVPGQQVADHVDDDTAVVMLTQVDYRTGRMHDLAAVTRAVQDAGAVMLWDLAHSAGAVPVNLSACGAEMAVGCGYKYLNGGPGAPAFLFVRRDLQDNVQQPLTGWLGHAEPFAFDEDYRPAPGMQRHLCGTPPVLSMVALHEALAMWSEIDMDEVRTKSIDLCELFITLVESACEGHGLVLVSPRNSAIRGSQVSFAHDEGYAVMQALIDRGVIGDFRQPNIMRFGFAPLYVRFVDVFDAVAVLREVLDDRLWDAPAYRERAKVT